MKSVTREDVTTLVRKDAWGGAEIEQACSMLLALSQKCDMYEQQLQVMTDNWINETRNASEATVEAQDLRARLEDKELKLSAIRGEVDGLRVTFKNWQAGAHLVAAELGLESWTNDYDFVKAISNIRQQLTAAQAREARLREALELLTNAVGCGCGADGPCKRCCQLEDRARAALADGVARGSTWAAALADRKEQP